MDIPVRRRYFSVAESQSRPSYRPSPLQEDPHNDAADPVINIADLLELECAGVWEQCRDLGHRPGGSMLQAPSIAALGTDSSE